MMLVKDMHTPRNLPPPIVVTRVIIIVMKYSYHSKWNSSNINI